MFWRNSGGIGWEAGNVLPATRSRQFPKTARSANVLAQLWQILGSRTVNVLAVTGCRFMEDSKVAGWQFFLQPAFQTQRFVMMGLESENLSYKACAWRFGFIERQALKPAISTTQPEMTMQDPRCEISVKR